MDLLAELKQNPFVLAPMAGITDKAFRSFMREQGCGVVITELVSANGYQYGSEKTKKLMQFDESQHPVGVQIFGEKLEALAEIAKGVEQMGADFVDMNYGCPVPKVVKKGAGSALLKDLPEMARQLRAVKEAVSIPVTLKTRTGWDSDTRNVADVAQLAYDEGITWVAIHGRTRSQGYNGKADWEFIKQVKANSPVPILGNGDLTNPNKAVDCMRRTGVDGVMIGRGCLKNPWIFRESLQLWQEGEIWRGEKDYLELFVRLRYHLESFFDERLVQLQTKKFASWFSTGYPESAAFRKSLFDTKDTDVLFRNVEQFFEHMTLHPQKDTSEEAFLMGGHG